MEPQPLMPKAAGAIIHVVRNVKPDQMSLRTPCPDWDVRELANHLTYWSAYISESAARKQPSPFEEGRDFTEGDWPERYTAQLSRAVAVWSQPGAWQGTAMMGDAELPAADIGGMMLGELVVHGWDLARATGQELACADDVAEATLALLAGMAEQGREYGVFGAEVPVPDSAPALHRALGLSGRDPGWSG